MKGLTMQILYDGKIYSIQKIGGINRYFYNLVSRLPGDFTPYLTAFSTYIDINYPIHPNLKLLSYKRVKFRPQRFAQWVEKLYSTWQDYQYFKNDSELNRFNIAHPTWNSLLTQQPIQNYSCPVVITVHDMIQEIFPDMVVSSAKQIEEKRKAILAAQAIICVSENTKKDLLERYKLPEDRVVVTHLASELDIKLAYGSELVSSRPYFLYVGSRYTYKNFDGLLLAFCKAVSVQPDILLCVVGAPFNEAERKRIAELNLTNHIENYGQVSDRYLAKLYRCSVAFVYPSLYEGFGIPPLEAMACGTAVVASNCSSIPEVVGDAGILFSPKAITDLADILLLLLNSPTECDRLIDKGFQRAKQFSWHKTAAQTVEIYRSVAS
jgi:glycosyltransferase involved in cell wall biosynthesis